MPPRVNKIRHDEETRKKIQAAQIINRLHGCVMGEVTLDAQQVSAAKALLNKVLPDLSAVSMNGEIEHKADGLENLLQSIADSGRKITDR